MRLTITLDEARGTLTLRVDRVLAYPPGHVPALLAAAVADTLQPATSAETEHEDVAALVPVPCAALGEQPTPPVEQGSELDDGRLRYRVLRALEDGATVEQVAERFGIDPAQVDRWDDDAALDGHTDLLADNGLGWPIQREAS